MTIVELFDEYPTPFSSEMMMMIVVDHDTNVINGNRKKHQSLLLRGTLRNPIHVSGVKLAYHY